MPVHGKYKSAAVVTATKIPIDTFNRWLDRRVIELSGDDVPGDGRGKPRRFGVRTITKLAIAHPISLLGIPPKMAVSLASKFTDEPQHGRPMGCPFPRGKTVLTVSHGGAACIHNVLPDGDIDSLLNTQSAIVVNIGAIISNLNLRLATIQ
jgi:hypothetical protein